MWNQTFSMRSNVQINNNQARVSPSTSRIFEIDSKERCDKNSSHKNISAKLRRQLNFLHIKLESLHVATAPYILFMMLSFNLYCFYVLKYKLALCVIFINGFVALGCMHLKSKCSSLNHSNQLLWIPTLPLF